MVNCHWFSGYWLVVSGQWLLLTPHTPPLREDATRLHNPHTPHTPHLPISPPPHLPTSPHSHRLLRLNKAESFLIHNR
jgi:hypothetical protein